MKVLLIAYHFPPDPAVGAVRPGRLAQYLAARGHEVTVLAGPLQSEPRTTTEGLVTVERLANGLDLRAVWARRRRRSRRQQTGDSVRRGADTWKRPEKVPFWKRQNASRIVAAGRSPRLDARHTQERVSYADVGPRPVYVGAAILRSPRRARLIDSAEMPMGSGVSRSLDRQSGQRSLCSDFLERRDRAGP